jgi:chaperone required for assembly of F1-ATPase
MVHQRLGPLPRQTLIRPQFLPDSLLVTLDGRPLKTPSGKRFELPASKRLLAALVANEWEIQETVIKPHVLPLVIHCINQYLRFSHIFSRHL